MYWNTVTPLLREMLETLMREPLFAPFVLVGGTSLRLQMGHRKSIDIDLFTDAEYGSIDITIIDQYFHNKYPYVHTNHTGPIGMGIAYYAAGQ